MNILEIFEGFKTQEQAIEHLEKARWHGEPTCPYCGSKKVCRHVSGDREQQRWQCQDCTKAFSVTVGTIFHGTHIALQKWFLVMALMLNAKKSASACQIARDLGMRRPTVWSMMHRIRVAMTKKDKDNRELLFGIIEADETYVGGKPRKFNKRDKDVEGGNKSKRGRGTDKMPVIGAIERGGRVVAQVAEKGKLNGAMFEKFFRKNVDMESSFLVTDGFKGYRKVNRLMRNAIINHDTEYANGMIHTNTIEGFWALIKRAWYGQHHHYSKAYAPLYIGEACFKYNVRKSENAFEQILGLMITA